MTDDIVTRLRKSHGEGCTCGAWNYSECGCLEAVWAEMFITEAADEIERLRNALAEQTIIHEVQKTNTLSEIERLQAEIHSMTTPQRITRATKLWQELTEETPND